MTEGLPDEEFLTVKEVATYLRVSQHTVWRWCKTKRLPAFQVGREWRIRKSALLKRIDELIAANKKTDTPKTD